MVHYLVLLAVTCLAQTVSSDTAYRLNTSIVPQSYAISITPFFDTSDLKAFTFDGEVTIDFQTKSAVNQIKLHSEDLNFTASDITVTNGNQNVPLYAAGPLEFVKNYTFALINLQSNLQVGVTYSLKIAYRGPIRLDLTGFYRNYYFENGIKKWLGATQMEPTHARKVFPCFDEPGLKATFTLTIDRPANFQPSRANTKLQSSVPLGNGYIRDFFYPTPIMPTYLVAFLVSEFEAARTYKNGTKEFGIYTRPEAKNQSDYAFDFGRRVEEALSAYFGIDYYAVDQNLKLDHVALPDFQAGAMENWGLVKYREGLLLYVPEESTPYYKYRVAQIMAHETTHMWFGDLVTCHWWSDTWLNEGFANYFQDFITSLIEPDVGAGDLLVTGSVYSAYDADSLPDSPPISNANVNSPAEISAHFGTITYQKAGSVIRMMHHLVGDEAFILGLNLYLNDNKFKPGYPEALYTALNDSVTNSRALNAYSDAQITDIMASWITEAGHPVLQVSVNYETGIINLTQKRFYANSSHASDEIYPIPITYTTGSSPNFNITRPAFIMNNQKYTLNVANIGHTWIIFNLQETGLYRVNYDDNSWGHIGEALKGDQRVNIHRLNRAKIVNDLFALYFSDSVSFSRLNDVFEFLEKETDYSVWNAALRGLNKLRNIFIASEVLADIESYIIKLTSSLITKIGYDVQPGEGTVALRSRMEVLDLACKVGHAGCNEHATKIFKAFRQNGETISPSLRPVAYCYGLQNGDESDYDFLWDRMLKTNVANEKSVIMNALGCTTSEVALKKYLYSMQVEDTIRKQELTDPLVSILSNYKNAHMVFQELKDNYDTLSNLASEHGRSILDLDATLNKDWRVTRWNNIAYNILNSYLTSTNLNPHRLSKCVGREAAVELYGTSMDSVVSSVAAVLHTQEELNEFETWLSSCTKCSEASVKAATKALTSVKEYSTWAKAHQKEISETFKNFATIPSASLTIVIIGLATILLK